MNAARTRRAKPRAGFAGGTSSGRTAVAGPAGGGCGRPSRLPPGCTNGSGSGRWPAWRTAPTRWGRSAPNAAVWYPDGMTRAKRSPAVLELAGDNLTLADADALLAGRDAAPRTTSP